MAHDADYSQFNALKPLLHTGFPKGDQVLVSGPPGSGKTILGMQFIQEGAAKGENGIFFTLDSSVEYIKRQMEGIGMQVDKLAAEGRLSIVQLKPADIYVLLDDMKKAIKRNNAKRIVVDSISVLYVYCGSYRNLPEDLISFLQETDRRPPIAVGDSLQKQMLYTLMREIRGFGCTALLVSELPKDSKWFSRDTVSEFACDGILLMDYNVLGAAVTRTISIVKMRRSSYLEGVHEFQIGKSGIKITSTTE